MMNARKLLTQIIDKAGRLNAHHQQYKSGLPMATKFMSTYVYDPQLEKKGNEMFSVLPGVIDSLMSSSVLAEVPEVGNWVKQVLDHNLSRAKKTRGIFTVLAYEMLEKSENITKESLKLARILGMCQEMLLIHFTMIDDIIDGSTTRRGVPCWYLNPQVGLGAINDAVFIHLSIYETLKHYFGSSPLYATLVDRFKETFLYTAMGQQLDCATSHCANNKDYSLFTMQRFNLIAKYKMTSNIFNMPVNLGLVLANETDTRTYDATTHIRNELGRLYQIQNDYLDCFGDEGVSGKAGTDIQEGKCTWFAVSALNRCNEAQRALFVECYASKDPEHVARIKQLYEKLNILDLYLQEESSIYKDIEKSIKSLPSETLAALFLKMLNLVYKRDK